MAYNEQYYKDKKQKILAKFQKEKDIFIQTVINSARLAEERLAELSKEFNEVEKEETASKEGSDVNVLAKETNEETKNAV